MPADNDRIKYLVPVKQLLSEHRTMLLEQSRTIVLEVDDELCVNEEQDFFLYLVSGKVNMLDADRQSALLKASDERAFYPLFGEGEDATRIVAQTHSVVLRFNRHMFNAFVDQELAIGGGEEEEVMVSAEMSEIEGNLFNEIMHGFNVGALKLPSLPEIASKVRRAIASSGCAAEDVSRIVGADPSMAARLIRVANGPLNRGLARVDSIQSAVVRLGLQTSKDLVTGFALKELFKSQSKMLNLRMRKLYEQSIEMAAISFTLSRQSGILNPDHLLLAGLLYRIGVIPILSYIEETGLIVANDHELDNIIRHLGGAVGALVIQHWELSDDLSVVVKEFDNWQRDISAEIDSCDMVIVAQIYYRLKHRQLEGVPEIDRVPAFKKIFSTMKCERKSKDFAVDVFKQADEEVALMMRLLRM